MAMPPTRLTAARLGRRAAHRGVAEARRMPVAERSVAVGGRGAHCGRDVDSIPRQRAEPDVGPDGHIWRRRCGERAGISERKGRRSPSAARRWERVSTAQAVVEILVTSWWNEVLPQRGAW